MYRKKGREKTQKVNSFKNGRGGFTLVELCVVMALIVIMTVMTVTFSVLVNSHASDDMAAYDFLEDSAKIEDLLCDWIAENDKSGTVFSLTEQTLTATALVLREYFISEISRLKILIP